MSDLLDRVLPVTVEDDVWWGRVLAWIDAYRATPAGHCSDFPHVMEHAIKAITAADREEHRDN